MKPLKTSYFAFSSLLTILGMIAVVLFCFTFIPYQTTIRNPDKPTDYSIALVLNLRCPKCSSEMEKGIMAYYDHGSPLVVKWGTAITGSGKLLTPFTLKEARKVTTFRCKKCGYIESYVNSPIDKGDPY